MYRFSYILPSPDYELHLNGKFALSQLKSCPPIFLKPQFAPLFSRRIPGVYTVVNKVSAFVVLLEGNVCGRAGQLLRIHINYVWWCFFIRKHSSWVIVFIGSFVWYMLKLYQHAMGGILMVADF